MSMSRSEKQLVIVIHDTTTMKFQAERFDRLSLATNTAALNVHSTGTEAADEDK